MKISLLADYRPHPGQMKVEGSQVRFINIVAGRRWGKDYCGARKFVRKIFQDDYPKVAHVKMPTGRFLKYAKPLLHYWAVAPDYPIGKIQQREIFSIFPSEFQSSDVHFKYDDNAKELRLFGSRILIEFKSADRPDSLVGVGLNGVYCTEFARFKETAWDANIRPTLTDKLGWGIFTTTPLPRKWFMDIIDLGNPEHPNHHPQHQNIFGKTLDNIRLPHIVEEVEVARKTLQEKWFRREYEASLECFEGQVYEEWDAKIHLPSPFEAPYFDVVIAGVDWGFSEPGCILVVGVKFQKRGIPKFYVLDEVYERGLVVDGEDDSWVRRAQVLKMQYKIAAFFCDTSEPGYIQSFRNRGLNALFADKSVSDGIQSVATAIHISGFDGKPSLYVNAAKCLNLPRQILQYQYADDEKPLGVDDHSPDALRYAIHTYLKHGGTTQYLRSS
jgi:hypothetical protein